MDLGEGLLLFLGIQCSGRLITVWEFQCLLQGPQVLPKPLNSASPFSYLPWLMQFSGCEPRKYT